MANQFVARKGLIALNDSQITGSLDVSGSITLEGSGSTLFEVNGSEGQLFSITDSLSGSLFAVSDVSGLPILEVFSDDTVKIGSFNNEAITVNGSTAVVTGSFTGSFVGDGSGLSGVSDFPYTGSAIINGSLEVIGNTNFTGSINLLNSSTNRINFNNAAAINQPQIRLKDYATGITMRGNDVLALTSNGSGMIGIKKTGIAAINFPSNAQVGFTSNTSVESYQPYLYFHRYSGNTIGIGVYGGSSTANTNGRLILQHITASGHISASTYYGDSLNIKGTQRSLYTTQSFQYSGSSLTHVTTSFENGTEEIKIINYTGSNVDNIVISGSDGINKIYTLSYDGNGNVTNIIVS